MASEMEIKLTPTQEKVAHQILGDLESLRREHLRGAVAVVGLSGVGKSLLAQTISQEVGQVGGKVLQTDMPLFYIGKNETQGYEGSYVITSTLGERDRFTKGVENKGLQIRQRALPGMNKRETLEYVNHQYIQSGLSTNTIAEHSFGVPLLARQLAREGMTEDMSIRIGAQYLIDNIPQAYKPKILEKTANIYLQLQPPQSISDEILKLSRRFGWEKVYDQLKTISVQQERIENKFTTKLASPIFVASESEKIYDTLLYRRDNTRIEIYAPGLSADVLRRVRFELGCDENWGFTNPDSAARMEMFGASSRKFTARIRDNGATEEVVDTGDGNRGTIRKADEMAELLRKGELPLGVQKDGDANSLFVHAHDHDRTMSHQACITNPGKVGWMTESLLQQLGVAYVVDNYAYGARYVYHPEDKRIEIIKRLD